MREIIILTIQVNILVIILVLYNTQQFEGLE